MPGPYPDSFWYIGGPVIFGLSAEMAWQWMDLGRPVFLGTFAEAEVVWERGIVDNQRKERQ